MNRTHVLIVVFALLGGLGGFLLGGSWSQRAAHFATPSDIESLGIGDHYRDLALTDLAGTARRLSEWDGKPRLLNFWASWCGPCIEEMPLLDALHRTRGDELHVLGIALDDPDAVREFLQEQGVSYPILLDLPGPTDASVVYGDIRGVLPFSVLIDGQGKVVSQRPGSFDADSLERWLARALQ